MGALGPQAFPQQGQRNLQPDRCGALLKQGVGFGPCKGPAARGHNTLWGQQAHGVIFIIPKANLPPRGKNLGDGGLGHLGNLIIQIHKGGMQGLR